MTQGRAGLIGVGGIGIALAIVLVKHEALSVMFGFVGMATVVLGILLPRLEGEFELSATGLKGTLRQARDVLASDELTLAEKGDAVSALLLEETPQSGTSGNPPIRPVLVDVPAFVWPDSPEPGKLSLVNVGREFEAHVRRAFEAAGWKVEPQGRGRFGDFVVVKGTFRRIVEAKAARHLSAADVAQIVARRPTDGEDSSTAWALVVPSHALSPAALRVVEPILELEVVYVPIAGDPRVA